MSVWTDMIMYNNKTITLEPADVLANNTITYDEMNELIIDDITEMGTDNYVKGVEFVPKACGKVTLILYFTELTSGSLSNSVVYYKITENGDELKTGQISPDNPIKHAFVVPIQFGKKYEVFVKKKSGVADSIGMRSAFIYYNVNMSNRYILLKKPAEDDE